MIPLTRKCRICGKNIFIERDKDRNTFFYDASYKCFKHKKCFAEEKKSMTKPWDDEMLDEYFKSVEESTVKRVDELLSKKKKQDENRELAQIKQEERTKLFDFIRDTYAPAVVPGGFYAKLSQIIAGNYHKLRGSIPPLELYDMWVQAKPRLDKMVANKEAKGEDMSTRWNYDLAVLLAQYPSYCEWKQKQESKRSENESKMSQNLTQMLLNRSKTAPKRKQNETEIDLSSMIDEI